MKIHTFKLAAMTLIALLCSCTTNRKQSASTAEAVELPVNCTLAAMNERDRALHESRLRLLRRSESNPKMEPGGFTFTVCLTKMPLPDLVGWAKNEQGCCSFLRISHELDESGQFAVVTVDCPPEYREEVVRAFGLNAPTCP